MLFSKKKELYMLMNFHMCRQQYGEKQAHKNCSSNSTSKNIKIINHEGGRQNIADIEPRWIDSTTSNITS
jgi:hypothetical protein